MSTERGWEGGKVEVLLFFSLKGDVVAKKSNIEQYLTQAAALTSQEKTWVQLCNRFDVNLLCPQEINKIYAGFC